ncbi:MAG TPA: DUF5696 domain-containing protein [Tepidisphaeraceae bacterium]|nr:DUF5696 domain-containing protein [Tepidisphaeraceae bacterium]
MRKTTIVAVLAMCLLAIISRAQAAPRDQWGAPLVTITHNDNTWTLTGQKQTVTLNQNDLTLSVQSGPTTWSMIPSQAGDMIVKSGDDEFPLRLAGGRNIQIVPWDTGFRTGLKISLSDWPRAGNLKIVLTLGLEGQQEDLVFDIVAEEGDTVLRQLDWPQALDARDVDYTLLSNYRGVLLPRHWPSRYLPAQAAGPAGNPKAGDTTVIQSNMVECWSMSWWGFQKGPSAMMVIIETPNDAAYQFDHPPGGPTRIGPRWRDSLGRFSYLRTARMCFFPQGNYVTLAKRYRQYQIDHGNFVSLREKIFRTPAVADLIGTPQTRMGILTNIAKDSQSYSTTQPSKNYHLVTFDQRIADLNHLKAAGVDRLAVVLTGWPQFGYDRQHPDELPPSPAAGGWAGMKRLADACQKLGYLFMLHDQYRDYYLDAPSYDPQFAIHEEDATHPSVAFPGTRYGLWKKGDMTYMNRWNGGTQTFLNNRLMLGMLQRNYQLLFAHGIHPQGIYLDVFGYVPPDEDFNPERRTTRTDAIKARINAYNWSIANIGIVGTEAGCDWTIPYADYTSYLRSTKGVPVPLYNLVYHDAIIMMYAPDDLHGFLNGGVPSIDIDKPMTPQVRLNYQRMLALHKRVALLELTNHEFLDANFRRERSTFSNGTTVTVDWDKKTVEIEPDVSVSNP